jgi:hypothetical protein
MDNYKIFKILNKECGSIKYLYPKDIQGLFDYIIHSYNIPRTKETISIMETFFLNIDKEAKITNNFKDAFHKLYLTMP